MIIPRRKARPLGELFSDLFDKASLDTATTLAAIAQQLNAQGIEAEVTGHLNWSTEVAEILRERAAGQIRAPK
jgi:hypothetical protein